MIINENIIVGRKNPIYTHYAKKKLTCDFCIFFFSFKKSCKGFRAKIFVQSLIWFYIDDTQVESVRAVLKKELDIPLAEIADPNAKLDGGDVLFTGILKVNYQSLYDLF